MIYVFGHQYAATDNDSLLSSIILSYILNHKRHTAMPVLFHEDAVKEETRSIFERIGVFELPSFISVNDLARGELALVDHNDPIESYGKHGIQAVPRMIVDHHCDVNTKAGIKIIRRVGSTCTILAEMMQLNQIPMTSDIARGIAYGIACDTKGLKSRKTSAKDIRVFQQLLSEYHVGATAEQIVQDVIVAVNISALSNQQLLHNSLKEYYDGKVGIAALEVLDDEYLTRLDELKQQAWNMPYDLYVLIVFQQAANETLVFYFNKTNAKLPKEERYGELISRSQVIVPKVRQAFSER